MIARDVTKARLVGIKNKLLLDSDNLRRDSSEYMTTSDRDIYFRCK